MTDSKNILYLYDLPKDDITSVTIAAKIKDLTNYEVIDQPQIKRDINKPFYTAMVRINDNEKFKEVVQAMKYFEINKKPCRALPYMKEVTAAQRGNMNKNNNLFIKGLPKELTSQQLDEKFKEVLGGDFVQSAKVSINPDYSSRGYGFVCLDTPEHASEALAKNNEFGFEVHPYQPKDRRDLRKGFNNIYIKNFPANWDEAQLRTIFGKYGTIKSLALMKTKVPGKDEEAPFAFVCFEDPSDKEYGPRCALNAVQQENDKEYDGLKLYVKEALPKQQRALEKKREQNRFKNSKKRCNLYVKNFPENTTEEQLRSYFEKYGEIESIKLHHKEGAAVYAFVCYKSPESATYAKQQSASQTLNGKQLFLNFYEQKEIRKIQQEEAKDRSDFQNHRKQSPAALNIDMLNRPETFQLLQYLMMTLQRQQIHQRPQFNNQQRPMRQGGQRGQYNQGGFQQRQQQQHQQQMPPAGAPGQMPPQQMPPQMRPPQQQPIMMQPGMQVPPMGAPAGQLPVQNLPPHVAAYNQAGIKVSYLVNVANPTYKHQVGEFIYEYVEQIAGDEYAPKITGMLIDLPIPEIVGFVTDFFKLQNKVNEALSLLKSQQ